jgi:hypothetical protein
MKSFIQHIKENQQAAYARYYALSQKKRHKLEKEKLEKQVSYIQDTCNIGVREDSISLKLDQLLIAIFYLGNALKINAEISETELNATLATVLTQEEINGKLEKFSQPEQDLSFEEKKQK